jgi:hypothetical protein
VDEAHAYNAYISHELERLIEFHIALGGSTDELVALVIEVLFEDFGRSILNFDDEAATIVYVHALPVLIHFNASAMTA